MELDPDRLARSPFLIGGLGALVTAIRFTPGASWPERAANVIAGALATGYCTPALAAWLQIKEPQYENALAFVLGLLAMSLLAAGLQAVKETPFGQILASWLTRKVQ